MQDELPLCFQVQEDVTINEISKLPTFYPAKDGDAYQIPIPENVFRNHAILERVKQLLSKGTPGAVVLELIAEMEGKSEPST